MDWEQQPLVFRGYPIPPSDNELKIPVRRFSRGARTKRLALANSPEYVAYKQTVQIWRIKNFMHYEDELMRLRAWARTGRPLGVQMDVRVHHARLFTSEGRPRRWDVTNFAKAVHDTFGEITGVDDSTFFDSRQRKVQVPNDRAECVHLLIGPVNRSSL